MIEPIQCNSTKDLFTYLLPDNAIWLNKPKGGWIFRGQRNADWNLSPKVFRRNEKLSFNDKAILAPLSDIQDQIICEFKLVESFLLEADQLGLKVPGDSIALRNPAERHKSVIPSLNKNSWPPPFLLSLLAIAQHHGVPTRLIDFTFNSLKALYFASIDAVEKKEAKELAVWAVNLDAIREVGALAGPHPQVELVVVPRHDNLYLNAQEGVFLLDRNVNNSWNQYPEVTYLEKTLSEMDDFVRPRKNLIGLCPVIYKITAPTSLAVEIITELDRFGVNIASMMPDFSHVVEWQIFKRDSL